MRRARSTLALGLLALAGCAHGPGPDGKPASSVPWCARGPVQVTLPRLDGHVDSDDVGLAPYVRPCMPTLQRELSDGVGAAVHRTIFSLTTNEAGVLADVCLLGTTLDPTSDFLECVAERLQRWPPKLPKHLRDEEWSLVTVLD